MAVAPDASAPSAFAAVVEGGVEADVLDQFLGFAEAVDVADAGAEGKGDDVADAAQADQGRRTGSEATSRAMTLDQLALLPGLATFEQVPVEHLAPQRRPGAQAAQVLGAGVGEVEVEVGGQAHALVAEATAEAIGGLGGALDDFAVVMEGCAVPWVLGSGIQDGLGGAGEVGLARCDRADLVVVGVGLLELAQVAALQDQGAEAYGVEAASEMEVVARGLEDHEIVLAQVLVSPFLELADGDLVKDLLGDGGGGRGPPQHGGGEAVGASVNLITRSTGLQADSMMFLDG